MSTLPHLPLAIFIRGLPGSGKSYIATALVEHFGPENVIVLDPDATSYDSSEYKRFSANLSVEGVDAKFHPYRFLRAQAYLAIDTKKVLIWNQAFTQFDGFNKTVINLTSYAIEKGIDLAVLLVEVEISPEVAMQRVLVRSHNGGHDVDEERFARFIAEYSTFADLGYTPVVVNGEDSVANSVEAINKALERA